MKLSHLSYSNPFDSYVEMRTPHRANASVANIFKDLIKEYEKKKPRDINVMHVARKYSIQHRRVYDLFNLLTSLKTCQNIERGKIAWNGINHAKKAFTETYIQVEIQSLTEPDLFKLFNLGPSPSLGAIATRFISLYLYLGVKRLVMRQVSKLFHDPSSDLKSLERRMYLVLSFLEMMGFIQHTSHTSEYELIMKTNQFYEAALAKRKEAAMKDPMSQEALLSRLDSVYLNELQRHRKCLLQELLAPETIVF